MSVVRGSTVNLSPYRLSVLPGLQRLYQEMATFEASALSDLSLSIQTLEKARTDYRAALLWMKDVSGKLHNPDYRDQLVRFREVYTNNYRSLAHIIDPERKPT